MEKRDEYSADKLSCARSTREVTPKWIFFPRTATEGPGRSAWLRGLGERRRRTPSWWRRVTFSSTSARRDRQHRSTANPNGSTATGSGANLAQTRRARATSEPPTSEPRAPGTRCRSRTHGIAGVPAKLPGTLARTRCKPRYVAFSKLCRPKPRRRHRL